MQLINQINQIWKLYDLPLWAKVYEILATGEGCGLVEVIPDALSIDGIKQKMPRTQNTLKDFFIMNFGHERGKLYKNSRFEFSSILASYCLICYIL